MSSITSKDKERRTEAEIIKTCVRILREEGPMVKGALFMRARLNSTTGGRILQHMIDLGMINYD